MDDEEAEANCFTFVWKLENISFCLQKKGEMLESPVFVVDAISKTKWKLCLCPRGNKNGDHIAYYLNREADSKGADKVEIKFELAFILKDGSALKPHTVLKRAFPKGEDYGYNAFLMREDVFFNKRSEFLHQDTLVVRCKIWKSVGDMKEAIRCTARTIIGVVTRSFLWNVKNFSTLGVEGKRTYHIKSIDDEGSLMSIDLYFTGGLSSEEIIHFKLALHDQTVKFCTLHLSLVDASGKRVECNQDEIWFGPPNGSKQLTFLFTKIKLLSNKNIYLPNDVLSLHWELAFSKGVVFEETVEVQHSPWRSEVKMSENQNVNNERKILFADTLNDNLKSLYDQKDLCDIKLKTNSRIFPAHKIILSAASSVFNAMFTNDMKEKNSDCVHIEDLSDDTINRMLLFVYTASVEDLSYESASQLYVAADKYAILTLKNICSSYLKANLNPSNVCEVLLLSDLLVDSDLKSVVQNYILKHIKEIVNSDEWKTLMETNAKLAAETVCLQYK